MSKISAFKLKSIAKDFATDKILSDGKILKCDLCDVVLPVDEKHQKGLVKQHIKTARHQNLMTKSVDKPTQSFIAQSMANAEVQSKEFELDLTQALVQSGIPLFKVFLLNNYPIQF